MVLGSGGTFIISLEIVNCRAGCIFGFDFRRLFQMSKNFSISSPVCDRSQVAQAIIEDRTTMWMHTAMPTTANYERAVTEHVIDLYEEPGELLALIEMIPKRDHLLIENIAVRPDRQGKGLGDRLLRHAEDVALSLGFAEVQLYTNAAFISNLVFYEKRGHQEHRRGAVVPGSTTVFMRKGLRGTRQ